MPLQSQIDESQTFHQQSQNRLIQHDQQVLRLFAKIQLFLIWQSCATCTFTMSKLLLPIRVYTTTLDSAAMNRHMLTNTVSITNNVFVASPLYFKSWLTSPILAN